VTGRVAGAAQTATSAAQSAPGYASLGGAAAGLVIWALSTYAFKAGVPGPLQTVLYILIPASVAGVASHLTRRYAAPIPPVSVPAAAALSGAGTLATAVAPPVSASVPASLIDPAKLEALADWLDAHDQAGGVDTPAEVQAELRQWAGALRAASHG
jgi:hypothetical protein